MKKLFLFISMTILLISACKGSEELKNIGKPSKKWIGKTIKLKFGPKNRAILKNIEATVKIKSIKKLKDGKKVFFTEKYYTKKGHNYLFFFWFGNKNAPQIISWKQIVTK